MTNQVVISYPRGFQSPSTNSLQVIITNNGSRARIVKPLFTPVATEPAARDILFFLLGLRLSDTHTNDSLKATCVPREWSGQRWRSNFQPEHDLEFEERQRRQFSAA